MIEDEELRTLYKVSSEEHIQQLEAGILHLEKNPEDTSSLEDLMREAHSLKGDSRMLGVDDVEVVSHRLEDIFGSLLKKETEINADLSDRIYSSLDAIRKLVHQAVTDEPSNINPHRVVAQLNGEEITDSPVADESSQTTETSIQEPLSQTSQSTPDDYCQIIQSHLEQLKQNPDHPETIDLITETLAQLQQDCENLGIAKIEALFQQIKYILADSQPITPDQCDRISYGVEKLTQIAMATINQQPHNIDIFHTLAHLMGAMSPPSVREEAKKQPPETPIAVAAHNGKAPLVEPSEAKLEPLKVKGKSPVTPSQTTLNKAETADTPTAKIGEPYRIDTIRVQTRHLDALMTQTGELTVTKIRIAHTATALEELSAVWEEWKNNRKQKHNLNGASELETDEERLEKLINNLRNTAQENSTRLELIAGELEEKVRTLRLLPLSTVFQLFPRMVRDLARAEAKEVELILEGGDTAADKHILEEIKDPLMHLVRNAIDHGIESPGERERLGKPRCAKIWLKGYQTASNILIEVADDGKGLDLDKIKATAIQKGLYRPEELAVMTPGQIQSLIFAPGFSTRKFITEVSGRGVGLDVVHTNVERLKGNITIESVPGQGCVFRIQLGTTLATANVLLVEIQGITHAIPIEFVETTLLVSEKDIFTIEGRETIALDGQAISVTKLADLLEFSHSVGQRDEHHAFPCILLNLGDERFGLLVDRLLDTQDVVIKPQSHLLKRVRNVTGATILGTGEVCMILNPQDLLKTVQKKTNSVAAIKSNSAVQSRHTILLAEDSIATRTQEKRILEAAGYEVVTAVDGLDGFNKLKTRNFDAVISDIQMPNLDGLSFTQKIRQLPEYNELPIILVTSLASDEDKRRGAEAGANAYITKDRFNQDVLVETLKRLV
jgi:two-component system chemotaxis sensor kinase CheA